MAIDSESSEFPPRGGNLSSSCKITSKESWREKVEGRREKGEGRREKVEGRR